MCSGEGPLSAGAQTHRKRVKTRNNQVAEYTMVLRAAATATKYTCGVLQELIKGAYKSSCAMEIHEASHIPAGHFHRHYATGLFGRFYMPTASRGSSNLKPRLNILASARSYYYLPVHKPVRKGTSPTQLCRNCHVREISHASRRPWFIGYKRIG